jgi:hypothetical protein
VYGNAQPRYGNAQAGHGNTGHGWYVPGTDHPSWPAGADAGDWPQPGTDYPSWPAGDQADWFGEANQPHWSGADQAGWPADGAAGGRPADGADPSWPYPGADHPSWPAGADRGDWPQPGTDYPSWPAGGPGGDWVPAGGEATWSHREAPTTQHHDERWQTQTPVSPRAPVPVTRWEYPARPAGAHAKTQQWSAQLARTQDPVAQTYYDLAFGDGRLQVMLTEPPAAERGWAGGGHARPVEVIEHGSGPVTWEGGDLRDSDSVQVADRILSDADYQAAEMRRGAADQATAIREAAEQEAAEMRRQAAARTAPVREAAEREAAEIRQQAAGQAAMLRETAEREAAAMRAAAQRDAEALRSAVEAMSAELGRMTSVLDDTLTGLRAVPRHGAPSAETSAGTATAPAAPPKEAEPTGPAAPADYAGAGGVFAPETLPRRVAGQPRAHPGRRSPAEPSTAPDDFARSEGAAGRSAAPARPAKPARPTATPAKKPQKRSRQEQAMRVATAGTAALLSIAAIGAVTAIGIHGFSFFVFRESGQGETPGNFKDANFLARQAAAQHHDSAPKGRHHKTPRETVEVHHK